MIKHEHDVVTALGQAIAQRIGEERYQLWFARNTKLNWEEDLLLVGVPNHFYQEWLHNTFNDAVRAAAELVFGRTMEVRFVIDAELFQAARRAQAAAAGTARPSARDENARTEEAPEPNASSGPQPQVRAQRTPRANRRWHRLDEFVVGACNRVAHASALSVVEDPGQGPNPLVVHGPVGTGKTHLLEGVYVGLRQSFPDWRIVFVTAEDFTNRFVQAMRLSKLGTFRKQFRECDALLLDDLNFLASKPATQEEFLHSFDVLQANGKQLVVTCDCHPKLTEEFAPELRDRLLGGAVWALLPPDTATRLSLLRAKSLLAEPALPDAILHYMAENLRGNVRELEGALHSVRHFHRVTGRALDLGLAREAVGDRLRHAVRIVQLADVDRVICQVLKLGGGALQTKQRAWAVSHPRMLAMYLARKHTLASYSEIGRHFGGRNHSTVVAAEKKVRQWLDTDGELLLGERPLRVREVMELVQRELGQ